MIKNEDLMNFEDKKKEIIKHAQDIVKTHCLDDPRNAITDTQLRGLLNKANSTKCIEEIALYIRYQMGKDRYKWEKVGRAILEQMEESKGILTGSIYSDNDYRLYALRYFFGCLIRYRIYSKILPPGQSKRN